MASGCITRTISCFKVWREKHGQISSRTSWSGEGIHGYSKQGRTPARPSLATSNVRHRRPRPRHIGISWIGWNNTFTYHTPSPRPLSKMIIACYQTGAMCPGHLRRQRSQSRIRCRSGRQNPRRTRPRLRTLLQWRRKQVPHRHRDLLHRNRSGSRSCQTGWVSIGGTYTNGGNYLRNSRSMFLRANALCFCRNTPTKDGKKQWK